MNETTQIDELDELARRFIIGYAPLSSKQKAIFKLLQFCRIELVQLRRQEGELISKIRCLEKQYAFELNGGPPFKKESKEEKK